MKAFRLLILTLVVCFAATIARADLIDPKITIGGGGSCAAFNLDSFPQSFSGLQTGCQIDFTNNVNFTDPGVTLFQIVVNVTSGFTGQLSCAALEGSIFGTAGSTATSCTFTTEAGFQPGKVLSLQFDNDPNGGGGFNNNSVDITIAPNVIPTPEPSTAILLLAGTGVVLALRRRR